MTAHRLVYERQRHAAVRTSEYLFNQLIPYIGNKRKLLGLIHRALGHTSPEEGTLVDFFAGSGVVSRMAKRLGYRVIANDWEPYARAINECYVACNRPPAFAALGGYAQAIGASMPCRRRSAGSPNISAPETTSITTSGETACFTCAATACGSTPCAGKSPPGRTPGKYQSWRRRVSWPPWSTRPVTAATPAASLRAFIRAGAARRQPPCIASPPI